MPRIIDEREVFKTKIFSIKEIDIKFDKNLVTYNLVEKQDSALLVPVTNDHKLILIREYFPTLDKILIALPKGRVENDNPIESANKELQEEAGYKAQELIPLGTLLVSPGNTRHKTHVYLARKLIESKLKGDEQHPIDVIKIPFADFEKCIEKGELQEARMIAALYLAKGYLEKNK
ncbi:MAG: NUDIX domain-containing protein [Candidatus Aenigmarchaeota archaeon]|nr:NUDIX domain-containing protein [Candidatus Aenigmarchaeota archaeon]